MPWVIRLSFADAGRDGNPRWSSLTAFVAEANDLGMIGAEGDTVREVLVHMIEEYARHNGHADFLRERIDAGVGQ
jgi:hypothetical protein